MCSFVHLPFLFFKITIIESHTTFLFLSSLALLDGKDLRRVDGQFHYKGVKIYIYIGLNLKFFIFMEGQSCKL